MGPPHVPQGSKRAVGAYCRIQVPDRGRNGLLPIRLGLRAFCDKLQDYAWSRACTTASSAFNTPRVTVNYMDGG
jgi:hypothetical protein